MGRGQAEDLFYGSEVGDEQYGEPEMRTLATGDKEWRLRGKLHREDGPARIYENGDIEYWREGRLDSGDPKKPVAIYFSAVGKKNNALAEWADSEGNISMLVSTPSEPNYNHTFMMDVFLNYDPESLEYLQHLATELGPLDKAGIGSIEWFSADREWYREDAPVCISEHFAHWMNPDLDEEDRIVSRPMSKIRQELEEKYGRKY